MRTLITNGKIILPNRIVENKSVIINGNKIEAVIDDAKIGTDADYVIDSDEFISMGKSSPFEGMKVYGRCRALFCGGYLVYEENV